MGTFIYSLMPFAVYTEGKIRSFIVFGKKEKHTDIMKNFTFKSYIIFLFVFSYLAIFPMIGIPILFTIFNIEFLGVFLASNAVGVIYTNFVLISILWFSFHIVYSTVSLQKVRSRIAQYIAIGSTLTLIFNIHNIKDASFLMSCLLISYFWIQYLIELREEEIKTSMEDVF